MSIDIVKNHPYSDSDKIQVEKTTNSIAAVVAGILGQKLYGNSEIDLEILNSFNPNARVTGNTTRDSIDVNVDFAFASSRFATKNNPRGYLEGVIKTSEFEEEVKQEDVKSTHNPFIIKYILAPDISYLEKNYHIKRLGQKFDSVLHLDVKDEKISGEYSRRVGFQWTITGTYDENGNVNVDINVPLALETKLKGKITKK